MEAKIKGLENEQSKMMVMIVERLENIIGKNINIKTEMTEKLNGIYPFPENEEQVICNEEPHDYYSKISILLAILERTTKGHEDNLMHLNQIV